MAHSPLAIRQSTYSKQVNTLAQHSCIGVSCNTSLYLKSRLKRSEFHPCRGGGRCYKCLHQNEMHIRLSLVLRPSFVHNPTTLTSHRIHLLSSERGLTGRMKTSKFLAVTHTCVPKEFSFDKPGIYRVGACFYELVQILDVSSLPSHSAFPRKVEYMPQKEKPTSHTPNPLYLGSSRRANRIQEPVKQWFLQVSEQQRDFCLPACHIVQLAGGE